MIEQFKALDKTTRFYVIFALGWAFESARSIAKLADGNPLIQLFFSGCALICFGVSAWMLLRKDKA